MRVAAKTKFKKKKSPENFQKSLVFSRTGNRNQIDFRL